jgi:putative FmdB family regulatory protein
MPLYDFHCNSCNKDFEIFCSIKDIEAQSCNICSNSLKQVMSVCHGYVKDGMSNKVFTKSLDQKQNEKKAYKPGDTK